ncbi:MAG: iron-containing redox enzyme family protein [Proteobacteria bacterium]|nr:iron-containing redox enzyme family protein [Pseudomonadota bacterium]
MNFYDQLVSETEAERQYLLSAPIIADVLVGKFNLNTYIAFLNQAYQHVRHTVPLLMQAGARLGPGQLWLQPAVAEYIEEEAGHEQWILNDLETCGCSRRDYERAMPHFESEMLVSYLYDTVQRGNPVGIFGMVLVLEGTSANLAPQVAEIVQGKLGLPNKAMSYLRSHGVLDQDHIRGFEETMNRIDDEQDREAIIHVARNVYRLYGNVYRMIPERAAMLDEQAAA